MKTLFATVLMAAALLSAGAFANDPPNSAAARITNVTVVAKNQAWPVKTQMTVEPCRIRRCLDA